MAINHCLPQVQACAIRVSRLDGAGVPNPGANNLYTSDAIISLTLDPQIEAGEEVTQKNGCGSVCINYRDRDRIKRVNLTMVVCSPDPFLHDILAEGSDVITVGDRRGWKFPPLNDSAQLNGVGLELWAKRIESDGSLNAEYPYAWWVLPKAFLTPGQRVFENGGQLSNFTGFALENANWFDGPLNDWPDPDGVDRAVQWLPTDDLPAASCGFQTLVAS